MDKTQAALKRLGLELGQGVRRFVGALEPLLLEQAEYPLPRPGADLEHFVAARWGQPVEHRLTLFPEGEDSVWGQRVEVDMEVECVPGSPRQ